MGSARLLACGRAGTCINRWARFRISYRSIIIGQYRLFGVDDLVNALGISRSERSEAFMDDPNEVLATATKLLETEPVKNLLSPVTQEVGELLGTVANCVRFYMTGNLEKICTKWARLRQSGRAIDVEEIKKVMPLLPSAAMVTDDELQEKWAILMESTATEKDCLPSFGQTLLQLTAEEVRFLNRLWEIVSEPTGLLPRYIPTAPLSRVTLLTTFDPGIDTGVNSAEREIFKDQFTEAQKANFVRLDRAVLVIDDVVRLGIISKDMTAEPDRFVQFGDRTVPVEGSKTVLRFQYSFTQYGISFMQAVTAKKEQK
jgi:hypothetical protein